jgi:hypothetical protein
LTIGKAKTFEKILPPNFLGVFDFEKIAFIEWNRIATIFYINDFNWNVTSSDQKTKEFKLVLSKIDEVLKDSYFVFNFENDDKDLKEFIKSNFKQGIENSSTIKINKNNFMIIYNKWLKYIKPTISIDWNQAKKSGIIEGDFYLADILSLDNKSIKEKLFVLLKNNHYELDRKIDESGLFNLKTASFNDNQKAHNLFWNKYERPPREEYWNYIVERRDLLVPQDVRERKGSFFTPQIWVELSQKYLTDALGENWQDEYYIWDCASGTGNLLNGLTNKYNIWASTLDQQDVDVMRDRIKNGANLLEKHIFQFDFLNDDFTKLPTNLQNIIKDKNERKKLIIYINPPYAEATTASTVTATGKNKAGVSTNNKSNITYKEKIGTATNELFAIFMARIYDEIPDCQIAQFSTMKFVNGSNFIKFKQFFKAKYLNGFIVPANSFDNVKGDFPIGFTIWDTSKKDIIKDIVCDVYDKKGNFIGLKKFYGELPQSINKWFVKFQDKSTKEIIGLLSNYPPDFQNQNKVFIQIEEMARSGAIRIDANNLNEISIYFSVRHSIEATWLNDRDQFLYPNDGWISDKEFQTDCLIFTLFHSQNRISSKEGTNHWIPFTEQEVDAKEKFESNFMSKFINGKIKIEIKKDLFSDETDENIKLIFSNESKKVLKSGLEIWKYYHSKDNINVNSSLYDIREYFQGRNEKTDKMNSKSNDKIYSNLMTNLKDNLKILAKKIEPKIYEYGFLLP